jgi:hypothetical protein
VNRFGDFSGMVSGGESRGIPGGFRQDFEYLDGELGRKRKLLMDFRMAALLVGLCKAHNMDGALQCHDWPKLKFGHS